MKFAGRFKLCVINSSISHLKGDVKSTGTWSRGVRYGPRINLASFFMGMTRLMRFLPFLSDFFPYGVCDCTS